MAKSTKTILGDEAVHYVSPRRKRPRPKPKMQPPLTPMIDVTFQLLIFFLIAFQIRELEGFIPASLPTPGVQKINPSLAKPIDIAMRAEGTGATGVMYEIGNIVTAEPKELFEVLMGRKSAAESDKLPVIIKPAGDVRWQFVVEAFNAAVHAKFKNISFARVQ